MAHPSRELVGEQQGLEQYIDVVVVHQRVIHRVRQGDPLLHSINQRAQDIPLAIHPYLQPFVEIASNQRAHFHRLSLKEMGSASEKPFRFAGESL